jgi:hypothetical protein
VGSERGGEFRCVDTRPTTDGEEPIRVCRQVFEVGRRGFGGGVVNFD